MAMTEQEIDETLRSLWGQTFQVGVVVRDIDEAVKHYERLGIGPFEEGPSGGASDRQVYGQPAPDVKVRSIMAQMGPTNLELMQPISGRSYQSDFLDKHGEGVVHLCAFLDDSKLDAAVEALESRGAKVVSGGTMANGGRFRYFATAEVGGLVLEIATSGDGWTPPFAEWIGLES